MIMLIENPLQLWKHLNARVKNSWMERIVVHKRLHRELSEIAKNSAGLNRPAEADPSKPPEFFLKELLGSLRRPSTSQGFESFLRRSVLQNIDMSDPYKMLDKATFRVFVRNSFRQYFVT